jgi:hypothetical protein
MKIAKSDFIFILKPISKLGKPFFVQLVPSILKAEKIGKALVGLKTVANINIFVRVTFDVDAAKRVICGAFK